MVKSGLVKCGLSIFALGAGYAGFQYSQGKPICSFCCSCTDKVANAPVAFDKNAWKGFELVDVKPLTENTSRFRFAFPEKNMKMGMTVSSFVVTKAKGLKEKDGKSPVIRAYTPVSRNEELGYFELVVKKYENGPMSSFIHSLKVGDKLDVKGPMGKLAYEANKYPRVGLIAGGTGITPMLQIVREVLANPKDKTQIDLLYGSLTPKEIILKSELDELQAKHSGQLRVHYTVDKPTKDWTAGVGPISEKFISSVLTSPKETPFVYVCGPSPMINAICGPLAEDYSQGPLLGVLKNLNYTSEGVFKF